MKRRSHLLKVLPILCASGALVTAMAPAGAEAAGRGALFVMTDSADRARGNEVIMYERRQNGDLRHLGAFATGRLADADPQLGAGPAPTSTVFGFPIPVSADGLGSANPLLLNRGNRCLFAVNAGSNSVSSFRVDSDGLRLRSVVSSQGGLTARFPVSLTERNGLLRPPLRVELRGPGEPHRFPRRRLLRLDRDPRIGPRSEWPDRLFPLA